MNKLKHVGWVYHIAFENGQTTAFFFEKEEDAIRYCKETYPNSLFVIVAVPIFSVVKE